MWSVTGRAVLPTTPTFSSHDADEWSGSRACSSCLKIITYGTERADQLTLDALCEAPPDIDFRQTFGMSNSGLFAR